jgi:hypothetical protein
MNGIGRRERIMTLFLNCPYIRHAHRLAKDAPLNLPPPSLYILERKFMLEDEDEAEADSSCYSCQPSSAFTIDFNVQWNWYVQTSRPWSLNSYTPLLWKTEKLVKHLF